MADRDELRFRAIFEKHAPPGIKVRWKRGKALKPAEANLRKGSMLVPRLLSLEHLGFALHECGHFWLKHFDADEARTVQHRDLYTGNAKPVAEREYEAERWMIGVMMLHGLPVPRVLRQEARDNVAQYIDDDTAKAKTPSHIKKWSQR